MKTLDDIINSTSIRPQLFITVAIGITFLLVALIFASTWVSDRQVREVLIEQGKQAAANLSENSSLALLYDSPDNAESAVQSARAFPGVKHINIYRADESLFYCSKMQEIPGSTSDVRIMPDATPETETGNMKNNSDTGSISDETLDLEHITPSAEAQIISEDEHNWKFFTPISIRAEDQSIQDQIFGSSPEEEQQIIGYVVITSSKDSLKNISRGILLSNALIALIIGLLILLALQKTIKRLTQPLYAISSIMQKAEQGEYTRHINTAGPLEVHHIANAFNRMIGALSERDETLRKQNLRLKKQANYDHLTGLMNRISFEQSLALAIDESSSLHLNHALCYMDLDKFKAVNDNCGHNAGDELLNILSDIFKRHIRKDSDALARVGGDEFALILKNCTLDKARNICENICQDVANYHFKYKGQTFTVGVSIGIVQINDKSDTVENLVSQADRACYIAKEKGRGQVIIMDIEDPLRKGAA